MAGQLSLYAPLLAWAVEWHPPDARLSCNGSKTVLKPSWNRAGTAVCGVLGTVGSWLVGCLGTVPHLHGRSNGALRALGGRAMALPSSYHSPTIVLPSPYHSSYPRPFAGSTKDSAVHRQADGLTSPPPVIWSVEWRPQSSAIAPWPGKRSWDRDRPRTA